MEALLPSEIARLVFGYLEDQKCDDAARSFLESSPHLQECRTAVLNGRRFNTRVNGYTLVDVFDKFSAAHSLVQERLTKVGGCEQVRQCGDLLEQLRFLIGGSRGQRFVVNINVPSQANSQTYGGSPIITSSIRKRQHSGSDRDRTKRNHKSLHQLYEKQPEPVTSQLGCDTVEATPLESLPGHTNSSTPHQHEHAATQDSDGVCCTSTKNDFSDCPPLTELQSTSKQICHHPSLPQHRGVEQNNSSGRSERCSAVLVLGREKRDMECIDVEENRNSVGKGKTMAISTDQLTTYSSIEVQTTPYALSDSESIGLDDEPIENLSLLTKELLNRTELQERIAENINKAILPIEMPSKDESICESMGGELNTSIMAELNNAIKSIVTATETDPIFEHFLDEIIGPNMDTDTSPDEDPDVRAASEPATNSRIQDEPSNTVVVDMDLEEETAVISNKGPGLRGTPTEVPLKQRLRSSSRQQNNKHEEDGDKVKEVEKTDNSLEDHNAAAIMSIINANIVSDKPVLEKACMTGTNAVAKPAVTQSAEFSRAASISSESQAADSTEIVENDHGDGKNTEKQVSKKIICTKSNAKPKVDQQEFITEQEMMAMPTLIVSSQEEMRKSMNLDTLYSFGKAVPCSEARFVPIAPKGPEVLQPIEPIYLRTVHVPVEIPKKIQPAMSNTKVNLTKTRPLSPLKVSATNRTRNRKATRKSKNSVPSRPVQYVPTNVVVETESSLIANKEPTTSTTDLESITLYANDNSFGTMIETGNMPAINLDDSMTLTGTGLSPYLKFNDNKSFIQPSEIPREKPSNEVPIAELDTDSKANVPITLPHTENILITRRTPKSLLKSRSKNNRLSLSTPRRRSSHIRALDFNTPPKSSSSEHKSSTNKSQRFSSKSSRRARSVCRTSLFKSPPFSNSFSTSEKARTPVRDRQLYKVPIATRSPAPKLMGGWDKYTGVGMILGGTSPHPSSSSSVSVHEEHQLPGKSSSSSTVKRSWDADLRQALQEYQVPAGSTSVPKKPPAKVKGRASKNSSIDAKDNISKSDISEQSNQSKHDKISKQQGIETIDVQIVSQKVDNVQDNAADTFSGAQKNSEASKKAKCNPVNITVELETQKDEQVANLQTQDGLTPKGDTGISTSDTRMKEQLTSEIEDSNKPKEKSVVKKYAKLKTLETKISRYIKAQIIESSASASADSSQRKCKYLKISPETQSQPSHMSQMIDLETPRKSDHCIGIPPTPRLLSPSSSTITPFTKIAEELSKVHSFISTPDSPPTPSIALTPKVMGENTIDAIKKGNYGTCSPYYQPSAEQPDILEKLISGSNNLRESAAEVPPVTSSVNIDSGVLNENRGGVGSDFSLITSSSKLEITQFEVIKDNLPKEEADRELKISTNLKSTDETSSKLENPASSIPRDSTEAENNIKQSSNHEDSSSSSGNESSDSSSSDTSSSSSCSSSCSCSSIATTSTPFKSVTKCKTRSNTYREITNDCSSKNPPVTMIHHNLLNDISPIVSHDACAASENNKSLISMQTVSSIARGETSPVKLLPLIKTQEEVDATAKETPAKDEALLSEANISETPSSSKAGIESLTNLNSKISALNSPEDHGTSRHVNPVHKVHGLPPTKPKLKIVAVQHLLPDVSVALKPPLVSEIVTSTTQLSSNLSTLSSTALDCKLSSHLEEKRLRLMAKFKNKSEPKVIPQKVKNRYKEKHDIPKSSGYARKTCGSQATSRKNTKMRTKQSTEKPADSKGKVIQPKATSDRLPSQERKFDECSTPQVAGKKSTNIEKPKGSELEKKDEDQLLRSKRIERVEDIQPVIETTEERRCSTEISDKGIRPQKGDLIMQKVDSNQCGTVAPVNSIEVNEDLKVSSRTTYSTNLIKLASNVSQRRDSLCKTDAVEQANTVEERVSKALPSHNEDKEVVIPLKKNQAVPMSKVDQIKRDLFSDEENNDQRTTRSRTRQLSDAQKNDPVLLPSGSVPEVEAKPCQTVLKKPKEELANVLECLKLVPANKLEIVEKPSCSPKSSIINKFAEYEFVYDDSIPIKKKRLKFSSSNLQYVINVELRDENYRECPKLMTSTNYEEIFNISPRPKKRVVTKKGAVKSTKSTKAEASKTTTSIGTILKNELIKPLASTSSPVKLKTISKVSKSTTKIQHKNLKSTDRDDKKKLKDSNQVLKKRKLTESEEDQLGEKKRRIADPQTLLKKLDLDSFLTSVHGPI